MKVYDSELKNWERKRVQLATVPLTDVQLKAIDAKARELLKETLEHVRLHNFLNLSLIGFLILTDLLVFTLQGPIGLLLLSLGHGFILYSLTVFTMHEGAGHKRIILGQSSGVKLLAFLVNQLSRLFFADPDHYALAHPSHHQYLGTARDQAFTHVVRPDRILKSFLPFAGVLDFNDYKIHSGDAWTKSKITTLVVGLLYHGILIGIASRYHSWILVSVLALIVSPWISFSLDRLRESSEHLLMKSGDLPEARELGVNFWGFLVGGGPWGQPCHLSHHLAPSLSWYQQLRLSFHVRKILTPEQRKHFLIENHLLAYPLKFRALMLENRDVFRENT